MTTFLFWNIRRKPVEDIIARLVARHKVDVLALAECAIPNGHLLATINRSVPRPFTEVPFVAFRRVALYSRYAANCFAQPEYEGAHFALRRLRIPRSIEILLALAHLSSPLHKTSADLHSLCCDFAAAIRWCEEQTGSVRTLVVGDLNVNPFHDGLLDVRGLNAVADRETVRRKDPRTFGRIHKQSFHMFYNPTWGLLGDTVPPTGTYYYDRSKPEVDPLWNLFDQVLLRKDLLDRFDPRKLRILTTDGQVRLVTSDGRPDADRASDHLPLLFPIDLRTRRPHVR